jgi:hypothetical protein
MRVYRDGRQISNRQEEVHKRGRLAGFRLLPQYWGRILGSFFYRAVSPFKNWSYRPLLRDSTSPFKRTCLLTRVKEVPFGLYRRNGQC